MKIKPDDGPAGFDIRDGTYLAPKPPYFIDFYGYICRKQSIGILTKGKPVNLRIALKFIFYKKSG